MPNHRSERPQRPQRNQPQQEDPSAEIRSMVRSVPKLEGLGQQLEQLEQLIDRTEQLARRAGNQLNPTQLRRVFHEFRQILGDYGNDPRAAERRLVMFRPKLAYAFGRGLMPRWFYELMKECISRVKDKNDAKVLDDFLTAFLAYHKAYGG
jgi:CRISPR type III-A-associated protein Csm2